MKIIYLACFEDIKAKMKKKKEKGRRKKKEADNMSKIVIYNGNDILLAEIKGKVKNRGNIKIVEFERYKMIESQTANKMLNRLEKVFKYHKDNN